MSKFKPFVEEPTGSVMEYPLFDRGKGDSCTAYLYRLFQERIVMYDGAMGTMIQKYKLGEEEYRGERYKVSLLLLERERGGGREREKKTAKKMSFLQFRMVIRRSFLPSGQFSLLVLGPDPNLQLSKKL